MLKPVRVPEKMSEQYTVLVGRETTEKLEKQTYSDAIKYLLDHHVVFPSELISHIEELIKNNELGYRSKEEFLYEAARQFSNITAKTSNPSKFVDTCTKKQRPQ